MVVALIVVGLILVVVGIRGTQNELGALLADDFTGPGNFWYFIFGIVFLGSLGYYPPLRNTSRLLIVLTLLVFMLSNGGFWQELRSAIENPVSPAVMPDNAVPAAVSVVKASAAVAVPEDANNLNKLADSIGTVINSVGGAGNPIGIIKSVFSLF